MNIYFGDVPIERVEYQMTRTSTSASASSSRRRSSTPVKKARKKTVSSASTASSQRRSQTPIRRVVRKVASVSSTRASSRRRLPAVKPKVVRRRTVSSARRRPATRQLHIPDNLTVNTIEDIDRWCDGNTNGALPYFATDADAPRAYSCKSQKDYAQRAHTGNMRIKVHSNAEHLLKLARTVTENVDTVARAYQQKIKMATTTSKRALQKDYRTLVAFINTMSKIAYALLQQEVACSDSRAKKPIRCFSVNYLAVLDKNQQEVMNMYNTLDAMLTKFHKRLGFSVWENVRYYGNALKTGARYMLGLVSQHALSIGISVVVGCLVPTWLFTVMQGYGMVKQVCDGVDKVVSMMNDEVMLGMVGTMIVQLLGTAGMKGNVLVRILIDALPYMVPNIKQRRALFESIDYAPEGPSTIRQNFMDVGPVLLKQVRDSIQTIGIPVDALVMMRDTCRNMALLSRPAAAPAGPALNEGWAAWGLGQVKTKYKQAKAYVATKLFGEAEKVMKAEFKNSVIVDDVNNLVSTCSRVFEEGLSSEELLRQFKSGVKDLVRSASSEERVLWKTHFGEIAFDNPVYGVVKDVSSAWDDINSVEFSKFSAIMGVIALSVTVAFLYTIVHKLKDDADFIFDTNNDVSDDAAYSVTEVHMLRGKLRDIEKDLSH